MSLSGQLRSILIIGLLVISTLAVEIPSISAEPNNPPRIFGNDPYGPSSEITSPLNNSAHKDLNKISGTAIDNSKTTGLSKVEVQLIQLSNNYTWSGSAWISTSNWLTASGTTNWSYDTSSISWTSGVKYLIRSRATDKSNKTEVPLFGSVILIDKEAPSSDIGLTLNGWLTSGPSAIIGTASDKGGSGIRSVEISIWGYMEVIGDPYWNGGSWIEQNDPIWLFTKGTMNWSYDGTLPTWIGGEYVIESRATDNAGNVESEGDRCSFSLDITAPNVGIMFPKNNYKFNDLDDVYGYAAEYCWAYSSGIAKREVLVNGKTISNKISTNFDNMWHCDLSNIGWNLGKNTIGFRATDVAGNSQAASSVDFYIDNAPPVSTITFPTNSTKLDKLVNVSGKAYDVGDSSVDKVMVQIKRIDDSRYWDGVKWSGVNKWLDANGTSNWIYETKNINFSSTQSYQFRSKARDIVKSYSLSSWEYDIWHQSNTYNEELPGDGIKITFDNTAPDSNIMNPKNNTFYSTIDEINGTASDGFNRTGVKSVQIKITRFNDNNHWTGFRWHTTETWLAASGTTNWSYNSSSVEWSTGKYSINSKAIDRFSNIEEPGYEIIISIDNEPPETNITSYYESKITGTASDTGGSGVKDVKIAISFFPNNAYGDPYWDGSKWIWTCEPIWLNVTGSNDWSYDTSKISWEPGEYWLYSRSTDKAGNVESAETSKIYFKIDYVPPVDKRKPQLFFREPTEGAFLDELNEICGDAWDYQNEYYGALGINIYINGEKWETICKQEWEVGFYSDVSDYKWESNSVYNITVYVKDGAGLTGSASTYFYYDVRPPCSSIDYPQKNSIIKELTNIEGVATSYKTGPIERVELCIRDIYNNRSWNGSGWGEGNSWLSGSEITDWYFDANNISFISGKRYSVCSRAIGLISNKGNVNSVDTEIEEIPVDYLYFNFDNKAPWVTIMINDIKVSAESILVDLTIHAADLHSEVTEMSFSFDNQSWTTWEPYKSDKELLLPSGNGKRLVYCKVKDIAGNVAEPAFDEIIQVTGKPDEHLENATEIDDGVNNIIDETGNNNDNINDFADVQKLDQNNIEEPDMIALNQSPIVEDYEEHFNESIGEGGYPSNSYDIDTLEPLPVKENDDSGNTNTNDEVDKISWKNKTFDLLRSIVILLLLLALYVFYRFNYSFERNLTRKTVTNEDYIELG